MYKKVFFTKKHPSKIYLKNLGSKKDAQGQGQISGRRKNST